MNSIKFNPNLKLIISDVDETIADVYRQAEPEMIRALNRLLEEKRVLFLVSGGGLESIKERITDFINPNLRHMVIIAHCSGAEVWGFKPDGNLNPTPHFGIYNQLFNSTKKKLWRKIINELISRYHLKTFPTMPRNEFQKISDTNPLAIMLADRGPQITFEFVNSVDLNSETVSRLENQLNIKIPNTHQSYDLRIPVLNTAIKLYQKHSLPVIPKLGGTFALDHIIEGVDKTRAVKYVLDHPHLLLNLGIAKNTFNQAEEIEIWGDKFSQQKAGPDFQMCLAVSEKVRTIDFRQEDPKEVPDGYNIQFWNGSKNLHHGLLEYLESR